MDEEELVGGQMSEEPGQPTESVSDSPQPDWYTVGERGPEIMHPAPKKPPYVPRGLKWVGAKGILPPPGMMDRDYTHDELRELGIDWHEQKRLRDRQPQAWEFNPPYEQAVEQDED
jgi:hypothetical protein